MLKHSASQHYTHPPSSALSCICGAVPLPLAPALPTSSRRCIRTNTLLWSLPAIQRRAASSTDQYCSRSFPSGSSPPHLPQHHHSMPCLRANLVHPDPRPIDASPFSRSPPPSLSVHMLATRWLISLFLFLVFCHRCNLVLAGGWRKQMQHVRIRKREDQESRKDDND